MVINSLNNLRFGHHVSFKNSQPLRPQFYNPWGDDDSPKPEDDKQKSSEKKHKINYLA